MRSTLASLLVVLLTGAAHIVYAHPGSTALVNFAEPETPSRAPHGVLATEVPRDTFNFGYYQMIGGQVYAVNFGTNPLTHGNAWTFDHGAPDQLEGWTTTDQTDNPTTYFQQITAASWGGHRNPVAAPIIRGSGSVWCGAMEDEAESLCWASGLGYGNRWCQRLTSPLYVYTGSGVVNLSFLYFEDSELNFDYGKVEIQKADGSYGPALNSPGFTGKTGDPSTGTYMTYNTSITAAQIDGPTFNLVFEFTSDNYWSDADGLYTTSYGPFGADDVQINGSVVGGSYTYSFEDGLQGWVPSGCPGRGAFFHVEDISHFIIQDPCDCRLTGNVACWADPLSYSHPKGQFEKSESPPADRSSLAPCYNQVLEQHDLYSEMPRANGTFGRFGFDYYPYLCPYTSAYVWSGRVGGPSFFYYGDAPLCGRWLDDYSSASVPPDAQLIRVVYEVYSSCDGFGIASTECSGVTNATPLVDNIQIRITGIPNAPRVSYDPGTYYSDGFGQQLLLSESAPGNADVVYDRHRGGPVPGLLGDTLAVVGPTPTPSTKYECRLWFRLRRTGPAQNGTLGYAAWKTRVTSGGKPAGIVGPAASFTWGWMDSSEVSAVVFRNRFDSYFRESDPSFNPGPAPDGDRVKQNQILPDRIFAPGTKIEYFVTANYTCTPSLCFHLPDTTGKNYSSFEILPSYRTVGTVDKFPCVLYVDAYGGNQGVRDATDAWFERGLNYALNGDGAWPPADPPNYDVFDYQDEASNWKAPLARTVGGDAGASLPELMGYRVIVVNTGRNSGGTMHWRDWSMFSDWLSGVTCGGNNNWQGFIAKGDNIARIISTEYPPFLNNYLGSFYELAYNSVDHNNCVGLVPWSGSACAPSIAIDAWGNWCPVKSEFDVMGTVNGGIGNLKYRMETSPYTETPWAEIVRSEPSGAKGKYRTVISGVAGYHETRRTTTPPPGYEMDAPCPPDTADIAAALYDALACEFKWTLGIGDPVTEMGYCLDPCGGGQGSGVDHPGSSESSTPADALRGNYPNPFNPRTEIRFSLAKAGLVRLTIYDVEGRRIKTVVKGIRTAGSNTAWWDGTDDEGHRVSAGIYWSRLTAGSFTTNLKLVVLR